MTLKVRLFFDDKPIEPSEYGRVQICSKAVDRIVNDIYEKAASNTVNEPAWHEKAGRAASYQERLRLRRLVDNRCSL